MAKKTCPDFKSAAIEFRPQMWRFPRFWTLTSPRTTTSSRGALLPVAARGNLTSVLLYTRRVLQHRIDIYVEGGQNTV